MSFITRRHRLISFFRRYNHERIINSTNHCFFYNVSYKYSWVFRNQRLAALKSFCRYASSNTVEHLEIFQQVLDIKPKKGVSKTVDYLSVDAITLLLQQPNPNTANGIRDLALLSLLYESGCRVQELIDIKTGNISFQSPATVTVTGKGSKVRIVPLSSNASSIIARYVKVCQVFKPEQTLFTNYRKEPLTRSGVAYPAEICRESKTKRTSIVWPYGYTSPCFKAF